MSSAGASFKHIYHLGLFNVESEVGKTVVLSTAVHIDRDFKEFSALRLGPAKGQRRCDDAPSLMHSLHTLFSNS